VPLCAGWNEYLAKAEEETGISRDTPARAQRARGLAVFADAWLVAGEQRSVPTYGKR